MFTKKEIFLLKDTCFSIVRQSEYLVTIHHKRVKNNNYYHKPRYAFTVDNAIKIIKEHDNYVLNTSKIRI